MLKRTLSMIMVLAIIGTIAVGGFAGASNEWLTLEEKADRLAELGLFNGTNNGYDLDETTTRAQAVTMVLRFVGAMTMEYNSASAVFSDVAPDHWADGNIGKAVKLGITTGTTETTFDPERTVNVREFITFFLRTIGYTGVTLDNCEEMALDCGVIIPEFELDGTFNRGGMVQICWQALEATCADGRIVCERIGLGGLEAFRIEFALFDRIKALQDGEKSSFMFSPLSIKLAFMLLANGSEGDVQQEILDFFGVENLEEYNQEAQELIISAKNSTGFQFDIANSVWLNTDRAKGAGFTANYKKTVSDYYFARAGEVTNDNAVEKINSWVFENTNGKITDLISDSEFFAALVNAVCFKADWKSEFELENTQKANFTDADNQTLETEFMHQVNYFNYFETNRIQVLEMPYKNSSISMFVFLPGLSEDIKPWDVRQAMSGCMFSERVRVRLPKFKSEFAAELSDIMKALGVEAAFDITNMEIRDVMFEGMLPGYSIFVDKIIHKTFIQVDEKGTEAAAATAIVLAPTSAPPIEEEPKEFTADHPFMYMIYDNESQTALFMGEYSYVE